MSACPLVMSLAAFVPRDSPRIRSHYVSWRVYTTITSYLSVHAAFIALGHSLLLAAPRSSFLVAFISSEAQGTLCARFHLTGGSIYPRTPTNIGPGARSRSRCVPTIAIQGVDCCVARTAISTICLHIYLSRLLFEEQSAKAHVIVRPSHTFV